MGEDTVLYDTIWVEISSVPAHWIGKYFSTLPSVRNFQKDDINMKSQHQISVICK